MSTDPLSTHSGRTDPERPFETHVARALVALRDARASGVLEVACREERCEIFLAEGVPVFAEGGSVDDSLGRVLVRSGRLTQAAYERVLERMTDALVNDETMRFGEVAIELGLLSPEAVMAALTDQVRHKVERCLRHHDVAWVFREDRSALDGLARFPMRIEQVVIDAISEPEEVARWEARLAPFAERFPSLRKTEGVMMSTLGLTATRLKVMRLCDGTHALEAVLASGAVERAEAVAVLVALLLADRVELLETRRVRQPPSVPRQEERVARRDPTGPTQTPRATSPEAPARTPELDAAAQLRAELRRARAAPPHARQRLTAEQAFALGKRLVREGKTAQARGALATATEGMPGSLEARVWSLFVDYVEAKSDEDHAWLASALRESALEALRHDKHFAFAHHALGRLFFDAGDDEAARRAFRIAQKLDPDDVDAARFGRLLDARAKK